MKKAYIRTFGCQMNVYDTGKMLALLKNDGYEETHEMDEADLVIVNTCSIREKPELKVHSFLGEARKIKRNRPKKDMTIAISGCVAQQEGQNLLNRYPDVNLVFGPDAVPNISTLLSATYNQKQVLDTTFLDEADYVFASDIDPNATQRVGAFVTIQKGCDNKCTFCIVPTTRGKEVSRPSDQIVAEVRALVEQGIKEITLIGQNVNSYGLKKSGERTFAQLLYAVADVPGVERIRYTTSHPRDMGLDVMQAYRDLPQLCSQLHLPVQSGSSRILRRMKRFYTRERYLEVVDQLRSARPDIVLSTDFIIGFPGETDADFEQTMSLLEDVRFHSSFSFKYSERPGTPALRLVERDPIDQILAGERLMHLQKRQREIAQEEHMLLEGMVVPVLVEGPSRHDEGVICGRTHTFKTVNFPGDVAWVGQTRKIRITKAFANSLRGEAV
ncbi:MAG: tRNA (N6-isopentenyl adenosine(37)-C2)-methylthiotransferase MiaB [Deltaproteobacteria bacterium]|nr:tRNA (N6-isopentenyl adenosine(37)-C2)-methylthiotransferase MiaB [Deltaproteobacteria bacterium]